MSVVPTLFFGVEYCATFQAALYIETHSLMHQSEFHAASVALSRAVDKRKSLINIHKNGYTATLSCVNCTKLKLLQQAILPSVQNPLHEFRRAMLVSYFTAVCCRQHRCKIACEHRSAKSMQRILHRWQDSLLEQF